MQKINKDLKLTIGRPQLSTIVVNEEGKLAYTIPPWRKVFRQMLKDFPIMCWYMLIGMILLFTRSLWAVLHPAITVTSKFDMLIYVYLMFISSLVIAGLLGGSYYFARTKLKSN
jgi:hypothetical protein